MKYATILFFFLLGACGTVDFENAPEGEFKGRALVVWVGPGEQGGVSLGDGEFVYVPATGQELTFVRNSGANASKGNETIRPGAFYTDGGSVPRAVQGIEGFNAWAFGPAYIIHDWLFVVRKCINDKNPWGLNSPIVNMDFQESADIMAETIKTVTQQYRLNESTGRAGGLISSVTAGPFSYRLWTEENACKNPEEDPRIQEILADINRKQARGAPLPRASKDEDFRVQTTPSRVPYVIVSEIGFPPG